MQLLDSPTIRISGRLEEVLQEIVHKIEIQSNFCIHHPDYPDWKLPAEILERLQKMPREMQEKYLSLQLRSFLYSVYYNNSLRNASDKETNHLDLDLENNSFLGVDLTFYERLHESNKGRGYFDDGWSIIREESDGTLGVIKGGFRLHIEREKHLQSIEKSAKINDVVAILLPKNRVQNGFYIAVGNAGISNGSGIVRVYFNLTSNGAVGVMKSLTQQLNKKAIPFSFKVLYNPKDYTRHDSGVLYFDKQDYPLVKEILLVVYEENQVFFKPDIPLFTLKLEPGLGLAEEPEQKFAEIESFGMNRCQIIANGLLSAYYQNNNSPEKRMQEIVKQFILLGIDVQRPYLNANSEDIYTN